jgi:1D-myo-inositol-triphosphate 3-kinase
MRVKASRSMRDVEEDNLRELTAVKEVDDDDADNRQPVPGPTLPKKLESLQGPPEKRLTLIAAGHASRDGGAPIVKEEVDGKPTTVLKVLDPNELINYTCLSSLGRSDPIHEFVPAFEGVREARDPNGSTKSFIRMTNLLYNFTRPKVIDVKIGVRTFLESEITVNSNRRDLYERMAKMYPLELTAEEREARAITKHRWMSARDANSTIGECGFRIDGVAGYRQKSRERIVEEIQSLRSREDARQAFLDFAEIAATDDGDWESSGSGSVAATLAESLCQKLLSLRAAMEQSAFVRRREFIGSSILLVADHHCRVGVFWIDFAKTCPVSIDLNHRTPWRMGNHEDGIITGIDSIFQTWGEVADTLAKRFRSSRNGRTYSEGGYSSAKRLAGPAFRTLSDDTSEREMTRKPTRSATALNQG